MNDPNVEAANEDLIQAVCRQVEGCLRPLLTQHPELRRRYLNRQVRFLVDGDGLHVLEDDDDVELHVPEEWTT